MGINAQGVLFFGITLEDAENAFEKYYREDEEEFHDFWARVEEEIDGIEFAGIGHHDNNDWILYLSGTWISAEWSETVSVVDRINSLSNEIDKKTKIAAKFCKEHGIEWEPQWQLTSRYS